MRKSKPERSANEPQVPPEREHPEVIVDFVFREGVLYIAVANVGGVPAHDVVVKFDKPFRGLGGEREIPSLALFKRLLFLAPYKAIETFVDTTSAYFARREPTRLTAHVTYRDTERRPYERRIAHDLSIYKDIAYLVQHASAGSPVGSAPSVRRESSGTREKKYGS